MKKLSMFLAFFLLTATVPAQVSYGEPGVPRFLSPLGFRGKDAPLSASLPGSSKGSGTNVSFGPNSGTITHPFFKDLVPGVELYFTGYGHESGIWYTTTVLPPSYFRTIQCTIAKHRTQDMEALGYYFLIYNAEDLNGNLYRIAEETWSADGLEWTEDYSANPELLYPASLNHTGLSWGSSLVTAINYTVPRNEFGMGPYGGCVVVRFDWGDGDYDYEYIAPGIGTVWDQWDDYGPGGYRISPAGTPGPTLTPTPTWTRTPTPTPTDTPASTPTFTPTPDADINHDGTVDELDLLALCRSWHALPWPGTDVVEDGQIDSRDLFALQNRWKATAPMSMPKPIEVTIDLPDPAATAKPLGR